MIKIIVKRFIAFVLDCSVYGLIVGLIFLCCPFFEVVLGPKPDPLFILLVLYPINMRDFLFKGASIGKALVGIRIYDKNWKKPRYSLLFRRSVFITNLFFQKYTIFTSEDYENRPTFYEIINKERNKFYTRVLERKTFKKLKKVANALPGRWEDNMNDLYDGYIQSSYLANVHKKGETYK